MIFVLSIALIFVHMIKLRKREDTKMFFVLSRAWDKEKVLSSHEESNLWIPRSDALPIISSLHRSANM